MSVPTVAPSGYEGLCRRCKCAQERPTALAWTPLCPATAKELNTNGSGKLPKDIQRRNAEHLTASANDIFAAVRIIAGNSAEEC